MGGFGVEGNYGYCLSLVRGRKYMVAGVYSVLGTGKTKL